ncbi:MAG: hypothetical protein E4H02_10335 [Lentisphaerales bacterium]|nr:MAG: hypothetical protein E4H02_10335 [Lentisphaerales bacterium]
MRRYKRYNGCWVLAVTMLVTFCTVVLAAPKESDGGWNLSMGGDNRTRYELQERFLDSKDDSKNVVYNRLRVHADLSYEKSFTFFIEGLDAREWTHDAPERGQEDDFDLHQAFAEFNGLFGTPTRVKLGRQKIGYGQNRILSAPTWGNKIRSFDAALIGLTLGPLNSDVFFGCPVTYESGFNTANSDEKLTGIYNVLKLGERSSLDLYAVRKESPIASQDTVHDRYTTGARFSAKNRNLLSVDAEGAYQCGEQGDVDIGAYALACRIEQRFDAKCKPMAFLEGNLASGDHDPADGKTETFVPPYQTTHGPYGIIDFFRWQNLRELAVGGSVNVASVLTVRPEVHAYWLDEAEDAWYSASGSALRPADAANSDTFAGSEISVVLGYELNKHCAFEGGYSVVLSGDVANEISTEDTVHYGYVQMIVKQ